MAVSQQKLKTLYVMQILLEKTDENHMLSAQGIIDLLQMQHGMTADRKSIYSDIELLKEFGMDIVQQKGTNPGYYVGSRDFELAELKMLVDAVQSSKFITQKKSTELIDKLKKQTNEEYGKQLQRQVHILNRVKADNETVFYNVDAIHNAISSNKQIQFKYTDWSPEGKLVFRKDGAFYNLSPWALTWDDEYYYLIGYDAKHKASVKYRVDKMRQVEVTSESRLGKELFENFDLADFSKKTFGMFDGNDERVTFSCKNYMVGVAIDRFGKDITFIKDDEENVHFSTTVSISQQFFGWLTGVGLGIKIVKPQKVKDEYKDHLNKVLNGYEL